MRSSSERRRLETEKANAAKTAVGMRILSGIRRRRASPPAHPENAQEETGQDRLEPERGQGDAGNDPAHRVAVIEIAETRRPPFVDRSEQEQNAGERREDSGGQSALQVDDPEQPSHALVLRQHSFVDRERLRQEGEQDGLVTADDRETGEEQGVNVEADAAHPQSRHADSVAEKSE